MVHQNVKSYTPLLDMHSINSLDPYVFPGEKLSKQQLQNSNIIKKLRAKEKERENTNTKQSKKIKELEEELQHLKQVGLIFRFLDSFFLG